MLCIEDDDDYLLYSSTPSAALLLLTYNNSQVNFNFCSKCCFFKYGLFYSENTIKTLILCHEIHNFVTTFCTYSTSKLLLYATGTFHTGTQVDSISSFMKKMLLMTAIMIAVLSITSCSGALMKSEGMTLTDVTFKNYTLSFIIDNYTLHTFLCMT